MSTSEKQSEANRKNARKSTGPKTEQGKQKVGKNAVIHGLYSHELIIRSPAFSEDPEEYKQLVDSLMEELLPVGQLQKRLVVKIANCIWRSQRVVRAETAHINAGMDEVEDAVRSAGIIKRFRADSDDPEDGRLTEEETKRIIEKAIGKRSIPSDSISHYILRCEMRLDRQLSRAYHLLRLLQLNPKPKRKRAARRTRLIDKPLTPHCVKIESRSGSLEAENQIDNTQKASQPTAPPELERKTPSLGPPKNEETNQFFSPEWIDNDPTLIPLGELPDED